MSKEEKKKEEKDSEKVKDPKDTDYDDGYGTLEGGPAPLD